MFVFDFFTWIISYLFCLHYDDFLILNVNTINEIAMMLNMISPKLIRLFMLSRLLTVFSCF